MVKKKLFEDIKINPARFYRVPSDVIRDRRFNEQEQLQILEAWESGVAAEPQEDLLQQVMDTKKQLERRGDAAPR